MTKTTKSYRIDINGFFGIDRSSVFGTDGCEQLRNFRIDASGALVKRSGRKKLCPFSSPVSSVIPYKIENDAGNTDMLVAAPPYVYAVDSEGKVCRTVCSDAATNGARVSLGLFGGTPYLFDGNSLHAYNIHTDAFNMAPPIYVPTYGKDWDQHTGGAVLERPNLLTTSVIITYKANGKDGNVRIPQGFWVEYIVVNGVMTDEYTFDQASGIITLALAEGDEIVAHLGNNISGSGNSKLLRACRSVCKIGGGNGERLVCFDPQANGSYIFCSQPTPSGELYFPDNFQIRIGNSFSPVTAVCPCGEDFVAFTEDSAILGVFEDGSPRLSMLSGSIGAISRRAVCSDGRNIYTVSAGGFYRIDINFSIPDESTVEKISSPLERDENFEIDPSCSVFDNEPDGELWFCCPRAIFIFNKKFKRFCSFVGMSPVALITQSGKLMLFEQTAYWKFYDELYRDVDSNQTSLPIEATVRTRWLDLGDPNVQKRGLIMTPFFSVVGGGVFTLRVETDSKLEKEFSIEARDSAEADAKRVRVSGCRFKFVRFSITSQTDERPVIYGAVITATS